MTPLTSTTRFGWSGILAGVFFSLAISVVLLQFGSAISLSATSPLRGEGSLAAWGVIATGIWLLWVQLLASLGGGYIAGYMRPVDSAHTRYGSELRDGVAGLLVWAISTVLVFIAVSVAGAFATYVSLFTDSYKAVDELTRNERNAAVIFACILGATSLLSAVAAWWAGAIAGKHRDEGTDFTNELSFRK